jgi:hypothetical protein
MYAGDLLQLGATSDRQKRQGKYKAEDPDHALHQIVSTEIPALGLTSACNSAIFIIDLAVQARAVTNQKDKQIK